MRKICWSLLPLKFCIRFCTICSGCQWADKKGSWGETISWVHGHRVCPSPDYWNASRIWLTPTTSLFLAGPLWIGKPSDTYATVRGFSYYGNLHVGFGRRVRMTHGVALFLAIFVLFNTGVIQPIACGVIRGSYKGHTSTGILIGKGEIEVRRFRLAR